jgi:hypothetical protein
MCPVFTNKALVSVSWWYNTSYLEVKSYMYIDGYLHDETYFINAYLSNMHTC